MKTKKGITYAVSIAITLLHILPFYLLLTTSLKPITDLSSKWRLPTKIDWSNFTKAWEGADLGRAFINNFVITAFALLIVILLGSCAAYPLSRFQTKLNKSVYTVIIATLIVPPLTILVPLYQFYIDINGMNTYWGVILLHVTFSLPMAVFLYTGFIGTIPRELDEAAMIDGLSRFRLFFTIILPLLKPIMATVLIMTGIHVWNDYQFSVFFLQKVDMRTITVALASFFGPNTNRINWVAAGSLLAALPATLLYLFMQRWFISGLASGAVKG
ncbi:carbohydrate ABC transporter permease [Paenibacillus sp. URB8-2]|uniref:carbohydrate ABC transporter permease n=1 Tax=Paenibacillus sp. URB8-2 TaxID=2741301 RepID=UPI0015BC93A0|nr:carbohydrate ABC transporter permease [Paenibacillus sp. URB8-2]BCG58220.1 putative ABC transporter permease protein AmyC [Paenibacillus sp. URB8-2]